MFRFQHSEYFLALLAIPLLVFLYIFLLRWKENVTRKMGDPVFIRALVKTYSPFKFLLKFLMALLAFVAIVIGLTNMQKKGKNDRVHRAGVDVILLLDVSKSMLAEDVRPSRLEKAKQLLIKLIDKLPDDRVGLILFAGRAYMQMPLTSDQGAAKMYLQDASPDVVPTQGTVISDALKMANSAFNSKEHKFKSIVLVSDGEDHDPEALKTAKLMADEGVMINTVGIGSADGATIIDPITRETKKDENGQIVITKLNEKELNDIANVTNGIYLHLDNIEAAQITLAQQLDSIEKKSLTDSEYIDYKNYFQWFLAAALILLLLEFLFSERRVSIA